MTKKNELLVELNLDVEGEYQENLQINCRTFELIDGKTIRVNGSTITFGSYISVKSINKIESEENEIEKIKEFFIGKGYHEGQVVQGEELHFFIKEKKLIQINIFNWADEEILESIKRK